jgi:hypothetical protein
LWGGELQLILRLISVQETKHSSWTNWKCDEVFVWKIFHFTLHCSFGLTSKHTHWCALCDIEKREMKGTEYVLVYSQENPSLFVIQRQIREGPNKVIPTGLYYVIDNTVYQSPTLLSLLQSRVVSIQMKHNTINTKNSNNSRQHWLWNFL